MVEREVVRAYEIERDGEEGKEKEEREERVLSVQEKVVWKDEKLESTTSGVKVDMDEWKVRA